MDAFNRYLSLMQERPDLFRNLDEPGEIRIIHDPERILAEQKRIRAELRTKGLPEHYIEIGILSEDEWVWFLRDMVEFPGGHVGGYIRSINRKSTGEGGFNVVLMCIQGNQVLMVRRFRHELRGWSWEFPRGFGEPGLSPEENALKELQEEIGAKPSRLKLLTNVSEQKGGTAVFYAEISPKQKIKLDASEGLSNYRWVSLTELGELVTKGKLIDWFSLWAYVLFCKKRAENEQYKVD